MDALVVGPARGRLVLLALAGLAFVVVGLLMMRDGGVGAAIGAVSVLFFGFCLVAILVRLTRTRPALVIDGDGIEENSSAVSVGRIPWSEVTEVRPHSFQGQRFLGIGLLDPEVVLGHQPALKRKALDSSMRMTGFAVNVPLRVLDVQEDDLLAAVARHRP